MALQTLRTHSKGWVAGILFFFLIVAFAAWGIEDMLRQGFSRTGPVMRVGGEEVGAREFENAYQRMIRNLQERLQRQFDYDTAKSLGFIDALVAELQSDRMFAQEARNKSLLVSDRIVREDIVADQNFRGADGRFDAQTFRRAIENAGYSEATYVALLKGNFARNYLVSTISTFDGPLPKTIADKVFAYRSEYRTAEVLMVPTAAMKPPAPADEQLAAFHKANAAKYTAPEYRSFTMVLVRPEDAAERVKVTDQDIEAEYARRKPEFTTPETRALRQLIFKDEAAAKQAYEALMGGRSFETVAKDIAKAAPIDLGKVTGSQVPIPALRDAAWKLKAGEVTQPIQSPLGWHIMRVDEIAPETVKPLAEVKAQLEKDFRLRGAVKILAALREQFDDALGGGAKLEAAAEKLKLKVAKIGPIDAQGKNDKAAAVEGLPDDAEFLRRVFRQGKGEEGDLVDLRNQGFYAVRVDMVAPSALKPLDTVKAQVTADWTAEERGKLAKAEAEKLMAEAKAGKSLEDLAKPASYTVRKSKPVNRGEGSAAAPGSLDERVFAVKPGEVTVAQTREGFAVVKVATAKDERTDDEKKKAREEFEKALRQAYEQDFLASYTLYLRALYPTKIESAAIDQLLGGSKRQ
ncbi:MAG TPA: peptidyl-prolyl cis-trans isomerase [Alphaproteobacteria bacterium]|jgi:peptidyl-prolyl cis-trans isomerase D